MLKLSSLKPAEGSRKKKSGLPAGQVRGMERRPVEDIKDKRVAREEPRALVLREGRPRFTEDFPSGVLKIIRLRRSIRSSILISWEGLKKL